MKKIFSILAMAAVVLCMASCAFGGSDRYKDGSKPQINYQESKINGFFYDAEVERCWAVVLTTHENSVKVEQKFHHWCTHFEAVEAYEWLMYYASKRGDFSATYGLSFTNDTEVEACQKHEDFVGLPDAR